MRWILPAVAFLGLSPTALMSQSEERPRARDIGMEIGVFSPGPHNGITDVPGVLVGQVTVWEGSDVRTGVTAILPHGGNVFQQKVPGAVVVGNGFGKLAGVTQVRELGEIETPILLTCTLCVWRAADAMVEWLLGQEGMEGVRSINPVVGETNDGGLNDIRSRPIRPEHVRQALDGANAGPVQEGSVGAGTGTRAFGWKGGIGTSSRVLPDALGGYTVGVLVQSNYGGVLSMGGAPVGKELGQYSFQRLVEGSGSTDPGEPDQPGDDGRGVPDTDGGSIMMVVATDAPLSSRNLERLARRALMGLARTGSSGSNGSGDYVLAFSSSEDVRRTPQGGPRTILDLPNDGMSGLFQATIEATEEAIYNSLLKATDVTGRSGNTAQALPLDEVMAVLRKYGVIGE
ncbi:MAG: P1 family peptidase [Gemmatimonadetes bacterium]|nr:P1 family peptidase [Gemmatimonadota bacterium]NNM05890.1 P1 family peptidase [Gemmatimonadota bacterium]